MDSTPETQVEEILKEAQAWYHETYNKKFDVIRRYDKIDKKWSWQLASHIGGATRVMQFGITAETYESGKWPLIKPKLLPYIRSQLIKSQARWEPSQDAQDALKGI